MKILSASASKEVDLFTIDQEPISSFDLMERACQGFIDWLKTNLGHLGKVLVYAGPGNNGGDGLAITRLLLHHDLADHIKVFACFFDKNPSSDCRKNLELLESRLEIDILPFNPSHSNSDFDFIIDGLFGSGLTGPVLDPFESVIRQINDLGLPVIAIDCPSGLMMDKPSIGEVVRAQITLTLGRPKLALFLPQNFEFVGNWDLIEIGLHPKGLEKAETGYQLLTEAIVQDRYRTKSKFDHKGTNGSALLICGSASMTGAVLLSSEAAMRSGTGKLFVHSVKTAIQALRTNLPEAILFEDGNPKTISQVDYNLSNYNAVGIGCGIGTSMATSRAIAPVLSTQGIPMVIDADALNLLSLKPDGLEQLPKNTILTPHMKEFERLFGETTDDFDRLERLKVTCQTYDLVIILKGAHSVIGFPSGEIYFNNTGNPGMATAGSGDVLTGILTGLLAQGYSAADAALIGCFVHGLAGDIAFDHAGSFEGLIASDLNKYLPEAFSIFYK